MLRGRLHNLEQTLTEWECWTLVSDLLSKISPMVERRHALRYILVVQCVDSRPASSYSMIVCMSTTNSWCDFKQVVYPLIGLVAPVYHA